MGWADHAIAKLLLGEKAVVVPHGNSMQPRIPSGSTVTLEPCTPETVEVGDAVLCRVKGSTYVHLVKAKQEGRVLIGNNHGGTNGWTRTVYGRVINVQ